MENQPLRVVVQLDELYVFRAFRTEASFVGAANMFLVDGTKVRRTIVVVVVVAARFMINNFIGRVGRLRIKALNETEKHQNGRTCDDDEIGREKNKTKIYEC
jgi:hypothetical protein